jgi:hypothetical protein
MLRLLDRSRIDMGMMGQDLKRLTRDRPGIPQTGHKADPGIASDTCQVILGRSCISNLVVLTDQTPLTQMPESTDPRTIGIGRGPEFFACICAARRCTRLCCP